MRGAGADVAVIGGGIVGLALARAALARQPGLKLVVLEKEAALAAHQTGHNSGVVHTGVYYRPGSLKAKLCVTGARRMIAYCRDRGLPLAIPGKVIVARTPKELAGLVEIERRGRQNGVEGLRRLDRAALAELEPHVAGIAALHVPAAAIVDYAAVARSFAAEIAAAGGEVRTGVTVRGFAADAQDVVVETTAGELRARRVANCAGLHADRIAALAAGRPPADVRILPFRGEYYVLAPRAAGLIRGLVYPVPDARFPFLGVHFTPRVSGAVEAGPNAVLAWRREGYRRFDASWAETAAMLGYTGFWAMAARYWRQGLAEQWRSFSRAAFVRALQGLLPELRPDEALPGGAGVRAQLVQRDGALMDDFCVRRAGPFLHVLNVPSPAATASLAIGDALAEQLAA